MLIDVTVTNFRSIRSAQTLSMVPGRSREARERVGFATGVKAVPHLLRTTAVFGPNGAGKTALTEALATLQGLILGSVPPLAAPTAIPVAPNLFDPDARDLPTEIEVRFVVAGNRYRYGLAADRDRVVGEWLFAVPADGRPQRWFERRVEDDPDGATISRWYINPALKGAKESWKKATPDHAPFLSAAVAAGAEAFDEPFTWFHRGLWVLTADRTDAPSLRACRSERRRRRVLAVLNVAGLELVDLALTGPPADGGAPVVPGLEPRVALGHAGADGSTAWLDLAAGSEGTRALFALAGPLTDALDQGATLVVDDLDRNLHPLVARRLVGLFHDPATNPRPAQLIFTCHDATLLADRQLHPDQVWLIDRSGGASELVALSDYDIRDGEALMKGYLAGRYGALPRMP